MQYLDNEITSDVPKIVEYNLQVQQTIDISNRCMLNILWILDIRSEVKKIKKVNPNFNKTLSEN